jgi:hypothetical protein
VQRLRGIRDPAAAMNHEEGVERVAVHLELMQKADGIAKNNKFG